MNGTTIDLFHFIITDEDLSSYVETSLSVFTKHLILEFFKLV